MLKKQLLKKQKKYFVGSDFHGTSAARVKLGLKQAGYEHDNEDHMVVVVGDITDGLRNENGLIDYLISLDRDEKLIAVKGNHDFGRPDVYMNASMNGTSPLEQHHVEWMESLPYHFENDDINVAHGIWIDPKHAHLFIDYERTMIWGSPCLIGKNHSDWWGLPMNDADAANELFDLDVVKYADSLDKHTFVGHFTPRGVASKISKDKLTENANGLYNIGKLHFVDSGTLHNNGQVIFTTYTPPAVKNRVVPKSPKFIYGSKQQMIEMYKKMIDDDTERELVELPTKDYFYVIDRKLKQIIRINSKTLHEKIVNVRAWPLYKGTKNMGKVSMYNYTYYVDMDSWEIYFNMKNAYLNDEQLVQEHRELMRDAKAKQENSQ